MLVAAYIEALGKMRSAQRRNNEVSLDEYEEMGI